MTLTPTDYRRGRSEAVARDRFYRRHRRHQVWSCTLAYAVSWLVGTVVLVGLAAPPISGAAVGRKTVLAHRVLRLATSIPTLSSRDATPLPTSGPSPIPNEGPDPNVPARFNGNGTDQYNTTSANWSGEVDVGTTFTAVVGKWIVPAVVSSTSPERAPVWIGIGGTTGAGVHLIQTGTTSYTANDITTYSAWYELLPAGPITIRKPVSPGDAMYAEIGQTSTDRWYVGIEDITDGWTVSGTVTYTAGPANSAEWIVEGADPTQQTHGLSLADFGTVRFHDLRIAGADLTVASLTSYEMINTAGQVLAYPGQYSTTTTGNFTDYYNATRPPPVTTAPPTVVSVTPRTGPRTGGATCTSSGTHLEGATSVRFRTTLASFRVTSPTRITATSPPGSGTVDVTVTTPDGTSAVTSTDQFTYVALSPSVTAVSPGTGPTSGGTSVTISGTNLTGASAVHFGSTPAASFQVTGPTRVTVTSPAHAHGPVYVTVTTSGGTSAPTSVSLFTYVTPLPTVSSLSPRTGPTAGGTVVTIIGTNFTLASDVRFGAKGATNFQVISPTRITATSPAHTAGTVNVTVTIPGGASGTSPNDVFDYLAPKVTSVSPRQGPTAGGTLVTIIGADFVRGARVRFGTRVAPDVTVVSPNRIVVRSPVGRGTVNVTVTIPDGTSAMTSADRFRYL